MNVLGAYPETETFIAARNLPPPTGRSHSHNYPTPSLPIRQVEQSTPVAGSPHVISRIGEKPTSRYCRHKDVSPHVPHSFGLGSNISLLLFFFPHPLYFCLLSPNLHPMHESCRRIVGGTTFRRDRVWGLCMALLICSRVISAP